MSRHVLQGRSEAELVWFQRRSFLGAAASWAASGGIAGAQAQARSNIVELIGDARLNGAALRPEQTIQTGDDITTGPGSSLVFVIGNSALRVRQNSRLAVERGPSLFAISVLRLVSGGVASVWGQGARRQIVTPTLTAGIRGTGVYAEVQPDRGGRSYLCNCYGVVDLANGADSVTSRSEYHQGFWGEAQPVNGRLLTPAPAINHTDEELEALGRLVSQRTAWQIAGRKGAREGSGYLEDRPGQRHPAAAPGP
jgi:hypothetical protein